MGNSPLPQPPGESRARPGWRPSPFRDGSRLTFSATLRGAEGRPRGCPFLSSFAGSTGSSAQRPLPGRSEPTRPMEKVV